MAADFQRYYGLDLRDAFLPGTRLTARYVLMLAEHLPEDSATHAAIKGGPEFRAWTTSAYMFAAMVNLLNAANYQRAHKRGGKPLIKPPVKKIRHKRVARVAQIGQRAAAALQRG